MTDTIDELAKVLRRRGSKSMRAATEGAEDVLDWIKFSDTTAEFAAIADERNRVEDALEHMTADRDGWRQRASKAEAALEQERARYSLERPVQMWLNGMSCVRPTDEFATGLGHDIIRLLKEQPKPDDVWRRIHIEVIAS